MDARNGNMMRYVWGSLGLIGILAWAWWVFGNTPYYVGDPTARACFRCEQNVCPATAASWRELFKKYGGFLPPEKKRQGETR